MHELLKGGVSTSGMSAGVTERGVSTSGMSAGVTERGWGRSMATVGCDHCKYGVNAELCTYCQ